MHESRAESRLKTLTEDSGVYIMKDSSGRIIYIGKAVNLKRRVSSYFHASNQRSEKINMMISLIDDFDIISTSTETEALLLERELIRRHRPEYNTLLKDGKEYPSIEITYGDPFPSIRIMRNRRGANKSRIFGPYPGSSELKAAFSSVRRLFRIRTCKGSMPLRERPCLYGMIGLCSSPCSGSISQDEYAEDVKRACSFLSGSITEPINSLQRQMEAESEKLNFEKCSKILKDIKALKNISDRQKIVTDRNENRDYIGFCVSGEDIMFKVMHVRGGKLSGSSGFRFYSKEGESGPEAVRAFIMFYYENAGSIPQEIYAPCPPEDAAAIESVMSEAAGRKVSICGCPKGRAREFTVLASKNAKLSLESIRAAEKADPLAPALEDIKRILKLKSRPSRIETYDISNLSGKNAVGSMTVLTDGKPDKKQYRKFKIRAKDTPDDFAMMREMISRRLNIDPSKKSDAWKSIIPDLIIIDGGKGQVSAVRDILESAGIPFAGLAKKNEEIYLPGKSDPIILPKESPALAVIRHGRDEAHRFAITYHRKLREIIKK
ncbi:MAG: excinuclease ABC subunit UvrC [bacterium]|nr:excinuclease ABC subunit UvrC [bacterium]